MRVSRRAKIRLMVIAGLLLYAVARFVLVYATFESYGVNPWLFLTIDCATTVTYVIGIEYLMRGLLHSGSISWWMTILWGVLAGVSFAAPYGYIFWAGNQTPSSIIIGLIVVVVLLAANAVAGVLKRMHKKQMRSHNSNDREILVRRRG